MKKRAIFSTYPLPTTGVPWCVHSGTPMNMSENPVEIIKGTSWNSLTQLLKSIQIKVRVCIVTH